MQVKERRVYKFSDFRGLDLKNKPLKVSPMRASRGKNFVLKSSTLSTRPAFVFKHLPRYRKSAAFLSEGDAIIDWYYFRDVTIYITEKHIYIEKGNRIFSEEGAPAEMLSAVKTPLNHKGLTPFFHEEKDCLFIFGLGEIYVYTILLGYFHVLYPLRAKPSSSAEIPEICREDYENLPTPYVPTLFIGNEPFEDVNMLSNAVKYRVFAERPDENQEEYLMFRLPTHYDPTKHAGFREEITFYKNRFASQNTFPVFLGVHGINFVDSLSDYGGIYNASPFRIKEKHFFEKDFEYFGSPDAEDNEVIVEEISFDRAKFFNLTVEGSNQTVFEFLLNIIEREASGFTENKLVKFVQKAQYKAIYRDAETNYISSTRTEEKDLIVYVQLRKFEKNEFRFRDEDVFSNKIVTTSMVFPNYPEVAGTYEKEYEITSPIPLPDNTDLASTSFEDKFISYCYTYLGERKSDIDDDDRVKVKARFYSRLKSVIQSKQILIDYDIDNWLANINYDVSDESDFPPYPEISGTSQVVTTETIVRFQRGDKGYIPLEVVYDVDLMPIIEKALEDLSGTYGTGYLQIRVVASFLTYPSDPPFPERSIRFNCASVCIPFSYQKEVIDTRLYCGSFVYVATARKQDQFSIEGFYKFNYNEKDKVFELRTRKYFFDYNNEPSIEVKVEFERNDDYFLIANNSFGITFGSENRLFLAGHKDYPNVERYNVSNDLLGGNDKSQSYETTYFPSKNYRIVGGKGAINGYVIATDTHLYVTKAEHPGDQKLFIRERLLDENGIVSYHEFKTNIDQTPLNPRCLIRFFNDILILTADGLYSVEISQNVLTNERLVKLRSGYVNTALKSLIKEYDAEKIFITKKDTYLYIFIGPKVFVADAEYAYHNEQDLINERGYEFVFWEMPIEFKTAHVKDNELVLLEAAEQIFYTLSEGSFDEPTRFYRNAIVCHDLGFKKAFVVSGEIDTEILKYDSVKFVLDGIFEEPAYLSLLFDYKVDDNYIKMFLLSFNEVTKYERFEKQADETDAEYLQRLEVFLENYPDISFPDDYLHDCAICFRQPIEMVWFSNITDFGNNLFEKTMFRGNIYVTRLAKENTIFFGYKTMRRLQSIEETGELLVPEQMLSTSVFDFEELDFKNFALSTFNDVGFSLPLKENNFLYIQFLIRAFGQIELNSIEVIYKLNRALKMVG